ncbi:MAG: hypothetical protein ABI560_10810, partial [Myxococcales bacterium]
MLRRRAHGVNGGRSRDSERHDRCYEPSAVAREGELIAVPVVRSKGANNHRPKKMTSKEVSGELVV